jgi:hypothetical protein
MFIVMVPPYNDEGRPTDLPPNHTAALDFDKIRNSDNYSDASDSSYGTVGLGAQEKKSDVQNVVTRLLALPHHNRMHQTLSAVSVS